MVDPDGVRTQPIALNTTPPVQQLRGILDQLQQEHGIGSRSVFVGGFSMGGGMALQFLARHPEPLGGVFGFGSFLATDSSVYVPAGPVCLLV